MHIQKAVYRNMKYWELDHLPRWIIFISYRSAHWLIAIRSTNKGSFTYKYHPAQFTVRQE